MFTARFGARPLLPGPALSRAASQCKQNLWRRGCGPERKRTAVARDARLQGEGNCVLRSLLTLVPILGLRQTASENNPQLRSHWGAFATRSDKDGAFFRSLQKNQNGRRDRQSAPSAQQRIADVLGCQNSFKSTSALPFRQQALSLKKKNQKSQLMVPARRPTLKTGKKNKTKSNVRKT